MGSCTKYNWGDERVWLHDLFGYCPNRQSQIFRRRRLHSYRFLRRGRQQSAIRYPKSKLQVVVYFFSQSQFGNSRSRRLVNFKYL